MNELCFASYFFNKNFRQLHQNPNDTDAFSMSKVKRHGQVHKHTTSGNGFHPIHKNSYRTANSYKHNTLISYTKKNGCGARSSD